MWMGWVGQAGAAPGAGCWIMQPAQPAYAARLPTRPLHVFTTETFNGFAKGRKKGGFG